SNTQSGKETFGWGSFLNLDCCQWNQDRPVMLQQMRTGRVGRVGLKVESADSLAALTDSTRLTGNIVTMKGRYTSQKDKGWLSMPGVFDRQKAIFEFRKFVSVHRAWQGQHANLAAARAQSVEHADIRKREAVDLFMQMRP